MRKTIILKMHFAWLAISMLLFNSSVKAQCLAPTLGFWPEYVVPLTDCDGQSEHIIEEFAYAGEFSMIDVVAGETYTFKSSVATDYFTITVDDGASAAAHGVTPLTWVATVSGPIVLIHTLDANCAEDTAYQFPRVRSFICGIATDEMPDDVGLSPSSATVSGSLATIYGQVFVAGLTDVEPNIEGQAPGIQVAVGISPEGQNTSPDTWTDWTTATHNPLYIGNTDEYMAQVGYNLLPGTYYYAIRVRLNDGLYVYGGIDGSGNGGFWDGTTYQSGVLTVSIPEGSLNGLYNVVTTQLDNGAVYTWSSEQVDYFGINWYKTQTVGPYYVPGSNAGSGPTQPLPGDAPGGYKIQKNDNNLFVPTQLLAGNFLNPVGQTAAQYDASTYDPITGVLTVEYYISFPQNNTTLNFRSVYTPLFLSYNENTVRAFVVYPNPVKNILNLSQVGENSQINIYTMTGQQVLSKNLIGSESQVDLSHLANGVYFARIASEKQTQTFKILKE